MKDDRVNNYGTSLEYKSILFELQFLKVSAELT